MKLADPVRGLVLADYPLGDVTQNFGENPDLYTITEAHNGIDIVRPHGSPLYAVEDGIIAATKTDPTGYGKNLRLLSDVENGEMRDWVYAHLHTIHVVPGQIVKRGQFIATMGNTGFVVSNETANGYWEYNPHFGTHLHLGLRIVYLNKNGSLKYSEYTPNMSVRNYNNGYRGRIDPYPFFRPPQLLSTRVDQAGIRLNSKTYMEFGNLLRSINL